MESDVPAYESLQFNEEIQRLMAPPPGSAASFTSLLELAPIQAVELLHSPEPSSGSKPYPHPDADRAVPLDGSRVSSQKVKNEAASVSVSRSSSGPEPVASDAAVESKRPSPVKRKGRDQKVTGSAKKKKKKDESQDAQTLPYVHVRARRGQATDSHSLAERARREKINARMKLLQELVPGCSKISGTALVLDEIITHVQSLQHQVELLSMKLAAVNPHPQIDFNLDSFLAAENTFPFDGNFPVPSMWPEIHIDGSREQYLQQCHYHSFQQPVWGKEEGTDFVAQEMSHLTYEYSANAESHQQVKMEM